MIDLLKDLNIDTYVLLVLVSFISLVRFSYLYWTENEYEKLLLTNTQKLIGYYSKVLSFFIVLILIILIIWWNTTDTYSISVFLTLSSSILVVLGILVLIIQFIITIIASVFEIKYDYFVDLDDNGETWKYIKMTNKGFIIFEHTNNGDNDSVQEVRLTTHWDNKNWIKEISPKSRFMWIYDKSTESINLIFIPLTVISITLILICVIIEYRLEPSYSITLFIIALIGLLLLLISSLIVTNHKKLNRIQNNENE